ncbi:MAG TPA: DUF2723 domain-containing protein [Bacteroidia bacterium]|nr:DUF2723 domain-containing protein [Sphingobacteriales bacterium]HPD65585.1 DUF2723 domain-containing protein [Bacteroidia bacterium]HRS59075.1 DUF2723 domain-containing protein [Bacteroidia bacterium]HRU68955.1 DUF2723 domain-containing protein [Bacteroidia bacterium]
MNEKRFNLINNILGWIIFIIAAIVYLLTMEPTVPLWDCGEFIAGSYKLEVVHPPGAPFFLMFNHLFTLFAPNVQAIPKIINGLSGIESALTVMLLFWTSTLLSRKFFIKDINNIQTGEMIGVFGAGIVGALAFTFSDTFWFSAVEAEVYAMSSTFTALVFWLLLKWERHADEPGNLRYLILIFYLMGLSIGVHLLSLLALPVVAFVVYFRKYKHVNAKGVLVAFLIGMLILQVINTGIIKWVPAIASKFEVLFVNSFGLPYWSGAVFFVILFMAALAYGVYYSHKVKNVFLNLVFMASLVVMMGFSSYTMVAIRSLANPPIDYSNPDNIFNMLSYINREQYGERPLFYGPDFSAEFQSTKDGRMMYIKKDGRYQAIGHKKKPVYDKTHYTIFPRMGDTRSDRIEGYKAWSGMRKGQKKPTFADNMRFFFRYQLGFMYWRYFAWNFIGRQNDDQGNGKFIVPEGFMSGNWISGIKFIDEMLVGNQEKVPYQQRVNRGYNRLYFLPFILGLLGLYFHYKSNKRDAISTFALFFITGILLVVYQNSPPFEPRERDYTLVGSFYVFAIWVGFGILMIINYLKQRMSFVPAASIALGAGLLAAPVLMASQEWDDHDRSHRYTSLDYGLNYLNSCAQDAILFTNGDNDTYPLWYAQEVEGLRDDVRVLNLQLLMTDWYVDQLKLKKNNSSPINFFFNSEQLTEGTRDFVPYYPNPNLVDTNSFYDTKEMLRFIATENKQYMLSYGDQFLNYYPTPLLVLPVDSAEVVKYNVVREEYYPRIEKEVRYSIGKRNLMKNNLLQLDILANNLWKRPIYFGITSGSETYLGLTNYFQQEGMAYRIVPVRKNEMENLNTGETGRVDPVIMYENMMNRFKWGNINDPRVYICSVTRRHAMNYRNVFATLGRALILHNEKEKAIKAIDKCIEVLPEEKVPHDLNSLALVEVYFMAGANEKGLKLAEHLLDLNVEMLEYFKSLDKKFFKMTEEETRRRFYALQVLQDMGKRYNQESLNKRATDELSRLQKLFGMM